MAPSVSVVLLSMLLFVLPGAWSTTFTITNNCGYMVWPGLLSSAGSAPLSTTGFALAPGASQAVAAPAGWSGRMWARTLCAAADGGATGPGRFACSTGDCGSGDVQCNGGGAVPPATLAEFTLDGSGGLDFFDVSLVDGYNLPMLVTPLSSSAGSSGSGKCAATGCVAELNGACPVDLRVAGEGGPAVACRSACEAFGAAQYCCSGAYGSPSTCRPSAYSEFFKSACPRAYSYAYDDSTSTFTCAAGSTDYAVTFCPAAPPASVKSSGQNPQAAGLPQQQMNDSMVYFGGAGTNAQPSGGAAAASNFPALAAAVALSALLL